ncbi:MAG: hypothetical protein ACQETF_07905 [Bacteroidota bacterium]
MDYLKSKKPYILIIILLAFIVVFDSAVWGEKTGPVKIELKAEKDDWIVGNETLLNFKFLKESEEGQ